MTRLWIFLTILALLAVVGRPTLAGNNVEREAWNVEHLYGDEIWTQCSQGMYGGTVWALAPSPGYTTDRILFAGTSGGVFKSTDGGASWSAVNTGLTNLYVRALALSPGYVTDRTLFAGTYGGGAFKSNDGGASWSAINVGLTNLDVTALALSPGYATDHTLFIGMYDGGVFKSSDGGASWSAVNTGLTNLWVRTLAISPDYAADGTLFAGTHDAYSGGIYYAGGVFKSTNGGASWIAVNTGLTNPNINALAVSPSYVSDHTLFAGTLGSGVYYAGGVFKSTNGGASWSAVNTGPTNLAVYALALSSGYASDHTIFAGTYGGGVFKSTDGGASWSAVNIGSTNLGVRALALSPGYANDHILFAGTLGGGIFKSTDGGASWSAVNIGLNALDILALTLSLGYASDHTLFAGTDGGVFKSTSGGASWSAVNTGLTNLYVEALALSPGYVSDRTLFAGTYYSGIFKSSDGGASWSTAGLTNLEVTALALSPGYVTDHTLFAGTWGGGIFKSTGGGASWSAVNTGLTYLGVWALAISPGYASDHTLFAGTDGGVFKSINGGASWSAINVGLTNLDVTALALSPGYATDHTLFIGMYDGGVFKSTNSGASWSAAGLTNLGVWALAFSPVYVNDRTLFAGTAGGVFKSTDGGDSWSAMNAVLGNLWIASLALTPTSPRTLFAGTGGSSVWQYTFDTIPPATVTDLTATLGCAGTVVLSWTAPGDDGNVGTATAYTVRYSNDPIATAYGWIMATDVEGEPTPQPAGTRQGMTVARLTPGQTYYFAIKASDERGNTGELSNSPGASAGTATPWTVMIYLDGDNNLDDSYVDAFNHLESAADNSCVNVVVAWDGARYGDSAYYKVKHDDNLNQLATYTEGVDKWSQGELNMGSPTSLSNFVQWARTNYPAQYYALFISNHGTGLKGTARDQTSGNDWITVRELGDALAEVTTNGTNKVDVVFADSCLMAMIEDAYQIRNYATYYVASENLIWILSEPYANYIANISASTSPRDLAIALVTQHVAWLNDVYDERVGYTLSAVDLSQIDNFVAAINNLAADLKSQPAAVLQTARAATQKFDSTTNEVINANDEYIDLYDFAQNIQAQITDPIIQNLAQAVMDAHASYVITNACRSGYERFPNLDPDHCHGVSIFFPKGDYRRSFYTGLNLDFAADTDWLNWGTQPSVLPASGTAMEWGPMLVEYVRQTNPDAPDDPNPPELATPLIPPRLLYLPLVLKGYGMW